MKKSGYTLAEIEDILMLEVFPACAANLYSVAGEWAGFNGGWISNTIVSSRRPNRFRRWMNSRYYWIIKNDWEKVLEVYKQM